MRLSVCQKITANLREFGEGRLFEIMKKEYPELREEMKGREWIVRNFEIFLELGE